MTSILHDPYCRIILCSITIQTTYCLFTELTLNAPEGIIAGPISEENFFEWEALISGPVDTVFEGT